MPDHRLPHYGPSLHLLLRESVCSLRLLGRQSFLALLGIVAGAASIVALLNIGRNAADEAMRAFKDLGSDTLIVSFPSSPPNKGALLFSPNLEAVKTAVPAITRIAPFVVSSTRVVFDGQRVDATLIGSTADLAQTLGLKIRDGRFLSDFDRREPLAVVGANIAQALEAKGKPLQIGAMLQIESYLFQIAGIADPLPDSPLLPMSANAAVILPIDGMRRLRPGLEISGMLAKAVAVHDDLAATATMLQQALINQRGGREVDVQIPQQLLDALERQANTFSYLLAGLGAVSLLAGGAGIMNVMLMSIAGRRQEIGVRMALGARSHDILNLFLLEAVILSSIGSVLGGILGLAVACVFTRLSGWTFSFAPAALCLGCTSSLLTGLFFGLYPALSAARLSPVQALRHE